MTNTNTQPAFTIVIPVYNEDGSIRRVLQELIEAVPPDGVEILMVDDGSTDNSGAIAREFAGRVRVLHHATNRGYGASLKTGIMASRARNVIMFDGDAQHDARDLHRMMDALRHYECVIGVRRPHQGIPLFRRPGKWLLRKVCCWLTGQRIPDINCGFRGGRRDIYLRMLSLLPGRILLLSHLAYLRHQGALSLHVSTRFLP